MATARKHPEFEIPPKLVEAMTKAIGPSKISALSSSARSKIVELANRTAAELGEILEAEAGDQPEGSSED